MVFWLRNKVGSEMYSVDHLVQVDSEHHEYWRHPMVQDNTEVCEEQMRDVKINGEWEIEKVIGESQ